MALEKNESNLSSAPLEAPIPTLICQSQKNPNLVLTGLIEKLSHHLELRCEEIPSLEEASLRIGVRQSFLIVMAIQTQIDLEKTLTFLTSHKSQFANGTLRIIAINCISGDFTDSLLKMRGSVDLLAATVSVKEVIFKMRNHLRLLHGSTEPIAFIDFGTMSSPLPSHSNELHLKKELEEVSKTFSSMKLEIKIKRLGDAVRSHDIPIRLLEVNEQNCVIEGPDRVLEGVPSRFQINIVDPWTQEKSFLECDITEVLGSSNGNSVMLLNLAPSFAVKLHEIVSHLESRRDGLMKFFLGARGLLE